MQLLKLAFSSLTRYAKTALTERIPVSHTIRTVYPRPNGNQFWAVTDDGLHFIFSPTPKDIEGGENHFVVSHFTVKSSNPRETKVLVSNLRHEKRMLTFHTDAFLTLPQGRENLALFGSNADVHEAQKTIIGSMRPTDDTDTQASPTVSESIFNPNFIQTVNFQNPKGIIFIDRKQRHYLFPDRAFTQTLKENAWPHRPCFKVKKYKITGANGHNAYLKLISPTGKKTKITVPLWCLDFIEPLERVDRMLKPFGHFVRINVA